MIMSLRRSSVLSTYLATIVAVVFLGSLAQAQTDGAIGLLFPVKQNSVCGGTCTPLSAPIMTVFDHEMQVAYECTTGEGGYGSVTAFTGETGTVKYSGFKNGAGKCKGLLFAYTNPDVSAFLKGYNYPELGVLYYDGHPAIDYSFPFGTPLYPAINGCVTYLAGAEGIPDGSRGHLLTIIPSPTKPAGGCQTLVNKTGYTVGYMHLASYYDPTSGQIFRCTSSDPKGTECNAGSDIVPCPGCAQQYEWVSTTRSIPIGYSGNFSSGLWGGVPAHLHFEVDQTVNSSPVAVDPYGWCGPQSDPYTALTGLTNVTLWSNFVLGCPAHDQ
jgi:murein DD-endopeptidase MepM/ murein hydrolase activator NlpD